MEEHVYEILTGRIGNPLDVLQLRLENVRPAMDERPVA